MNIKAIKITGHRNIESLKMFILQKLKLVDHKKDCVAEFDDRLKSYISRNRGLKIEFQIDRIRLEKDIKFYLSLIKNTQPFPENFEMGNPHNRWLFDPIPKTAEDMEKEDLELQGIFQETYMSFENFLRNLVQLGDGQISIKEN